MVSNSRKTSSETIAQKMVQKQNHQYWGERDALPLVKWLNHAQPRKEKTRNEETEAGDKQRVIEALTAVQRAREPNLSRRERAERWEIAAGNFPAIRRVPTLQIHKGQPLRVAYSSLVIFDTTDAFVAITHLETAELIDRIRQCRCGKWFYQRFSSQKACSKKCRQAEYNQTHKAERARKAKELYWRHHPDATKRRVR